MSYYSVSIGEHEYRVSVSGSRSTVDGESVPVHLTRLNDDGLHLLRRERQAVEIYVHPQDAEHFEVLVGGRRVVARVDLPNRRARALSQGRVDGEVKSPMPGLIVSVAVQPGDHVERGQTLLVLESMKMQMQIRSPMTGRVSRVNVITGKQVEKGVVLTCVEPEGSSQR